MKCRLLIAAIALAHGGHVHVSAAPKTVAHTPAPTAAPTTVVVLLPPEAPASRLTFEGLKVGGIAPQTGLCFQLPVGVSGRLRAGRGGGTTPGNWPVFYADIRAQPGQTIHLLMDLTLATTSSQGYLPMGSGALYFPQTERRVTRGEFQRLTPAAAQVRMAGWKIKDAGLIRQR